MFLNPGVRSLRLAVRLPVVAKYLGQLMLPLALLTCVPLAVSMAGEQWTVALRYAFVVAVLVIVAWPCARIRLAAHDLQTNEALVVSALVFALSALIMTVPLMAYGLSFVDAFFESVSGVTTTGLSTLPSVEDRPAAFLFSRAWMQWVGGLGVVVLALALLIDSGPGAKQLGFDERETEDIVGGTRAHARRVLVVYLIITSGGIVALLLLGVTPLDAVANVLAAVSTGGFSTKDASLGGHASWAVRAVILTICFAGALSFAWYYRGYYKNLRDVFTDERLRALVASTLVATGLLFVLGGGDHSDSSGTALANAAAMAISAQTTAGFSTLDLAKTDSASKLVLIGTMLVGGESGSTAGGIKILRILILFRLLEHMLVRASVPRHSVTSMRVAGKKVTPREVEVALAIASAYGLAIFMSWLAFLVHGHDPLDALFDVVSAVSTSGLSTGITGPELNSLLKLVLCIDMLLGRVEIIAFLVLFNPLSWIGRRRRAR